MVQPRHVNFPTNNNQAIEISRRIKSGQRTLFDFLKPLQGMVALQKVDLSCSPDDVRVNLVSRFDNLTREDSTLIARLGWKALDDLFDIANIVTCNNFASICLEDPIINNKGDGWQTIEMPVMINSVSFAAERIALTNQIDVTLGQQGSIWEVETPTLQVMEFRGDKRTAAQMLAFVAALAPRQTEVFDASTRIRPTVL